LASERRLPLPPAQHDSLHGLPSSPEPVCTTYALKEGVGSFGSEEAKELDRLAREYDEHIAAMDEELARKWRSAFIPGDPRDDAKKPRRTGT
jgi:hypothetical protein